MKKASAEELPGSDWHVDTSVGDYFGKLTKTGAPPTVGSTILRQVALGRIREPRASRQTAFVPGFLLQVPSLTSLYDRL